MFDEFRFDGAVIDYHLSDGTAVDLIEAFRPRLDPARIIVLTGDESGETANRVLAAGARYARKPAGLEAFEPILRKNDGGHVLLYAYMADKGLTPREWEVLPVILSASSRTEAARELGISEATVKNHIRAILDKCQQRSLGSLARHLLAFSGRHERDSHGCRP